MHEAVCEVLVQRLPAEHVVIPGAGHFVPNTGTPFNDRLRAFLHKMNGLAKVVGASSGRSTAN